MKQYRFSESIKKTHKSFIREILKLTQTPEIISFAGGLPNKDLFPVEEFRRASDKVLTNDGADALQYSTTEGYLPLREYIANRYKSKGLTVSADEIIITNGAQQGLDLSSKAFIDKGDVIVIERPGYLGAIQAFSIFQPKFETVELSDDGVDTDELEEIFKTKKPKFFYSTPNFQNPTGLTYSIECRKKVAELAAKYNCIIIEDDPYGELRFIGEHLPSMKTFNHDHCVLLGSFSKIVAPGLRTGWAVADKEIIDKFIIAKQASDLHSNYYTQRVIHQYVTDNQIDSHISKIKEVYLQQRSAMIEAIQNQFPKEITFTQPEGGMFLWATLPEGYSAMELFDVAVKHKVAFVPGDPFYTDGRRSNTLRLNYSCSSVDDIKEGVTRLTNAISEYMK